MNRFQQMREVVAGFDLSDAQPIAPLAQVVQAHILSAFQACDKNKTHTARALGINRRTLYRLLAKYGVVG